MLGFLDWIQHPLLLLEESDHPCYMHGGRWYRRDSRNRMIFTCWFVITVEIMGAWSLALHAVKSISVHNCLGWRALTHYACEGGLSCVTVGVDLEWSVDVVVEWWMRRSFGMAESIEAIKVEVSSESSFKSVFGHVTSSCEGQILTTTNCMPISTNTCQVES